jgi:hypothetical protein
LGDDAVVAVYERRRFVVSCEGANQVKVVQDKMAQALGITLGEHLWNRIVSFLQSAPCVLVLDNFETLADGDPAGAAELVATLRSAPDRVVLGIGYRGATVPTSIKGMEVVPLGPLTREPAKKVFLAAAGDRHSTDPSLDSLLNGLDGVPLALVILGALSRAEPSLDELTTAWQEKRTDLFQSGSSPDRTSSLPVSIELSWERLSADARAALSLAAQLPDGWPLGRRAMYLPDEFAAGVVELGGRALLHADERQRCLAPIRQHVLAHHPPESASLQRLFAGVRVLATRFQQIGGPEGSSVVTELASEFTNITEVISTGLSHEPELVTIVPNILTFQRFTGLGDEHLGHAALTMPSSLSIRADIFLCLGLLHSGRSNNMQARELFGQALPIYQRVGAVLGEANCLSNLGEVEFRESNNDRARELFGQALPLYQRVGAVLGEANCLRNLGQVEFRESNNDRARGLFGQALPLYERIRDRYSQAVVHAWLARTTDGDRRTEHCVRMDELSTGLNLRGFRESLYLICGC